MRREYGSIQRLGRNHYRVRWWANDDAGVWKHMSHNVRGTRSDAADFLAQKKIEHGNDSPDPRKRRMSVDQAYKLYYLPWAERRVGDGRMAPSSLNMFRSAWRAHVQPRWGQTMLSDVTALDVEEWLLSLPPSVAPHSKAVMKRTFERARIAGVTTADPFSARLDMPKKPATKRKATYPRATLVLPQCVHYVGASGHSCVQTQANEHSGTTGLFLPLPISSSSKNTPLIQL